MTIRPPLQRRILSEVERDPDIRLRFVVADKVERHFLKGIVSVAGLYSCEVCVGSGETRKGGGGGGISWPYPRYLACPTRDLNEHRDIIRCVW